MEEPPKALPNSPPLYLVEFPLEENSPINVDSSLRTEDEDAIALTLVTVLNLKRIKEVDLSMNTTENSVSSKKSKATTSNNATNVFTGYFGSFTIGHNNPKNETAGKSLPSPQQ